MQQPRFVSIRDIADRLDEPFYRVRYAVAKHKIEPVQRVGIVRLFSEDQIPAVKAALAATSRGEVVSG